MLKIIKLLGAIALCIIIFTHPASAQIINTNSWNSLSVQGWIYGGDNCSLASCKAIDPSTDIPEPPNALKIIFPIGFKDGFTPALAGYTFTQQNEIYWGFWFKFSSNWTWNPVGNKITYIKLANSSVDNFFVAAMDSNQKLAMTNQHSWTNFARFNSTTGYNPTIVAGQWYWLEMHMKINTPGIADGLFELWLNNTLVMQHFNVPYRPASEPNISFEYVSLEPIWGGAGNVVKQQEEYIWYDYSVISTTPIGMQGVPPLDGGGGGTGSGSGGGDASASGGSGCGFVKDNGKGKGAKGEGLTFAIMLIITLAGIAIVRKIAINKGSKGVEHIKRMIHFSLFFFVIFCIPVFANAADYYVATNGNDSNPGTEAQPWQHIAYATCGGSYLCPVTTNNPNKLTVGDTLYVRGGTYNEYNIKFTNSGASGNPITIKGYPNEVAVVDAGFTAPDGLTTRAVFDIDGNHYITLDSLTIMRGQKANVRIGYNLSTTNITVRNCDIMNVNAYDNSGEIYVHPLTDNILIENNKLHGRGSLSQTIHGNGVHIFYAGNLIIRNNEIYNSGGNSGTDWTHIGIHYKGSVENGATTIIENNLIYNQVRQGIQVNKRDAIIRNNIIYNVGDWGIRVFEESSSCDRLVSSDNQIIHNTIVDVGAGIWLDRSTSCPGAVNTIIKDNIIYNFSANDHRGLSVWPYSSVDTSDTTFANNLIYSPSFSSPIRVLGNYYTVATIPSTVTGTGNIQQAPIFKDYANKDFTLLPNSPGYKAASDGYDMGADTTLPPTPTPDGGGGGGNTPPPSSGSGGDSTSSGGSGCGFVRDSNNKGPKAKGEGLTLMIMLIIALTGIALAKRRTRT